jgi:hypothetical protein
LERYGGRPFLSTSVLNPSGIQGVAPSSAMLQTGQGIPAPPQSQASNLGNGKGDLGSEHQGGVRPARINVP